MVWQMPRYPESRTRSKSNNKSSRSASPLKHDTEDYQFGAMEENLVVKWQVVDESENMRMNALDWSNDRADGRLLLAA
jgi:hypothetical protein